MRTKFLALEQRYRLHWRLVDFALFMMVIGPLIAPYFAKIPIPIFQSVATFIFNIGGFICPQPQYAFIYGDRLYAICYRCLAALMGLIIARWLNRPNGLMVNWSLQRRFLALVVCVIWLEIDLYMTRQGYWQESTLEMLIHGLPYGISVGGMVFVPLVVLDNWLDQSGMRVVSKPQIDLITADKASAIS